MAFAVGWNGVFLAEIARLAPRDRIGDATEALHFLHSSAGSYGATYAIFGLPALAAGLRLLMTAKIARDDTHS